MRKTREILRLHYELKLSQRQIAQSVEAGQSTISDCLKRFRDSSLGWPLPSEVGEAELEAALFQYAPRPRKIDKQEDLPDFDRLHEELQRHRNMTLQLLWEEYRVTHPDGYAYSPSLGMTRSGNLRNNTLIMLCQPTSGPFLP
jgi:transposase